MRHQFLILLLCAVFSCITSANNQSIPAKTFNNEKPIVFKANDGQVTDAFEGHIMVTENRNNPDSRKIRINYVRFPSTGKKQGSPIIYLSGGPGGSGIGTAKVATFPFVFSSSRTR